MPEYIRTQDTYLRNLCPIFDVPHSDSITKSSSLQLKRDLAQVCESGGSLSCPSRTLIPPWRHPLKILLQGTGDPPMPETMYHECLAKLKKRISTMKGPDPPKLETYLVLNT